MVIDKELIEESNLKQKYDLIIHEDLVIKLLKAHNLLNRAKFVLEQEQYLSLPVEIDKFLKED